MRTKFLAGIVTAGFLLTPLVFASDQAKKKSQDKESDEVAKAVAWERYKDAAAARQARIEAKHPTVFYNNSEAERSADQDKPKTNKPDERQPAKQDRE